MTGDSIVAKAAKSCAPVVSIVSRDLAKGRERVWQLAQRITYLRDGESTTIGFLIWESPT